MARYIECARATRIATYIHTHINSHIHGPRLWLAERALPAHPYIFPRRAHCSCATDRMGKQTYYPKYLNQKTTLCAQLGV